MLNSEYPLPAFYFSVRIGLFVVDTSFRDVEGIGNKFETEPLEEGGENRYVHQLPTKISNSPLVLKRGIGSIASPLIQWCKETLEGGLASPIQTMPIMVSLMDENSVPARNWYFNDAYPVEWSVEGFSATKNEVAIEEMKVQYAYQKRVL